MPDAPDESVTASSIFGSLDGMCTGLAVVWGSAHLTFDLAILLAFAGALSMAGGEFVSALTDPLARTREAVPRVVGMGAGTFGGTMLPFVPAFLLPRVPGEAISAVLGVALAILIGKIQGGRRRNYLLSVLPFLAVAIPTIALAVLLGVGA